MYNTYQCVADQSYNHYKAEQQGHHNGDYLLYELQRLLGGLFIDNRFVGAECQANIFCHVQAASVAKNWDSNSRWWMDCFALAHPSKLISSDVSCIT